MLPSLATGQQGQLAERCKALVLRPLPCSSVVPALGVASSPCSEKDPLHEQVYLSFVPWGWVFLLLAGEQRSLAVAPALPRMAQGDPWRRAQELVVTQQNLICALPCSVLCPQRARGEQRTIVKGNSSF